METKVCSRCKVEKPVSEFSKNKAKKDGYTCQCKACNKDYYQQNKGKLVAQKKDYYQQNKDQIVAYRTQNKDKLAAYFKDYRQQNKAAHNARKAKRRATKFKATPEWADLEQITEFYECCSAFKMYTGREYHVDHIVPLQSKLVCGLHCEANLQVLEESENKSKNNRYWPDMPT